MRLLFSQKYPIETWELFFQGSPDQDVSIGMLEYTQIMAKKKNTREIVEEERQTGQRASDIHTMFHLKSWIM